MLNVTRILRAASRLKEPAASKNPRIYFSGSVRLDESTFKFLPSFLSPLEQETLLCGCLKKLDSANFRRSRRKAYDTIPEENLSASVVESANPLHAFFKPDSSYDFQKGHFDGVITNYRETHVTSWPAEVLDSVNPILRRLESLLPGTNTQVHILHLGTEGEILPHVDNPEASGTCIIGVSLGSSRVLRMEKVDDPDAFFEVLLPSGSVYLQRDEARYGYQHSILKDKLFLDETRTGGQRVSIMLRDFKS